jgi:membrane protease subunit HflK
MPEHNHESNNDLKLQSSRRQRGDELDVASKSLSEALRVSFIILKVIMFALIGLFLIYSFRTVGPDEQAIVLQFGKIRGTGENRILGPGPHWVFPYPVNELVKIPVAKKTSLAINSFWYFQTADEMLPDETKKRPRPPEKLDPVKEGYCITRSEEHSQNIGGSAGSDYNIVHSKWQLIYQIDDPERFFRNVYIDKVMPGQSYADVIEKSITPLLQNLIEDTIVTAMVHYTIDEAISSQAKIPNHVKKLLQENLDKIESGIKVISVQLNESKWPRQVDYAFQASIRASQARQRVVTEAKTYADNTLNEAAGLVAEELLAALNDGSVSESEKELLWSQLAGSAQEKIAQARAYRTKVVETAKANAEYLQQILPEYRKRPELVIQKIYQDAIEYVYNNADEKVVIQPAEGAKGREIRILLNRDPKLKPKSDKEEGK